MPDLTKVTQKGFALMSPIQPLVDALEVEDESSYLQADALLGRIRSARSQWKLELKPIRDPAEETLKQAKLTVKGVDTLDTKVDGPLAHMETVVKTAMRQYKLKEAEDRQRVELAAENQKRLLLQQAEEKRRKAVTAATPQMRGRLAAAAAEAETKAEQVQAPAAAVKGMASTARTVKKWRVKDLRILINTLTKMGVLDEALIVNRTWIDKHYNIEDLEQWQGIEVYSDVIIAGR